MADWKKIRAEYIRGGISYAQICAKYGVPIATLKRIAGREHWVSMRDQVAAELIPKMLFQAAQKELKQTDRIQTIADRLLDKLEADVDAFVLDGSSLRQVTAAIKDLREIKGYKSELDLEEQKARIEKLRREAVAEDQSKDIRVVISDDLADYLK